MQQQCSWQLIQPGHVLHTEMFRCLPRGLPGVHMFVTGLKQLSRSLS